MRIALSGSTGLIGGAIFQFLRVDHQILRIGRRPECDVKVDFSDVSSISALDLSGCEALIHCAGVVDGDFVSSPQRAWSQAVAGSEELAKRALANGIKRVIYFSAAHVYGELKGVISEDNAPDPLTHYAMAHYVSEQIFKSYLRKGLQVIIVRPNALYGIPADWNGFDRWEIVPYDFPLQAVYKQKLFLKSSGEQSRNFIALEDMAGYVQKLLGLKLKDDFFVLNAVGSETMRIVDFAQMCADVYQNITGRVCAIEKPPACGYVDDFQPVTKHAGFAPSGHVKDFLSSFIKQVIEKAEKGVIYGNHK